METEHRIVKAVYAAKEDSDQSDYNDNSSNYSDSAYDDGYSQSSQNIK